jgi:hypothetical protein
MKKFEDAFLGLIFAGVLLMVVGLGLMLAAARPLDGARMVVAEGPLIVPSKDPRLAPGR